MGSCACCIYKCYTLKTEYTAPEGGVTRQTGKIWVGMKKTRLYYLAVLFSVLALPCEAGESRHSVGMGIQYGGIVGWQGAQVSEKSISRFSVGTWGVTVGHDRFVTKNIVLGAQVFANIFLTGVGLNINYYLGSKNSANFVVGVDVFRAYEPLNGISGNRDLENNTFISFGYMF